MVNVYLKAILDYSPESIVLLGKNHEVLIFNKTISQVLQQYFGKDIHIGDLYYPDFVIEPNRELYLDTFEKALRGESITVQDLTENENTSIWFEYRMAPVYDDDDTLLGVSLSAKDITREKIYEISLRESEDRFKKIAGLAPIGILITDSAFDITYANNESGKIFEYGRDALVGRSISDLVANLTLNENHGIKVDQIEFEIESPIFHQEKFEGVTESNAKIDILLSSSSFYSQAKRYYIFIIQDITHIRVKDELISQQNLKLRDIAWHQSHVIRAPLANIMGIISLFQDKNLDIELQEKKTMYQAIIDSAQELDKVIYDIVKKTK